MHEHVRIPAGVEARPIQGLLPVNMDPEGDVRLYRFTLPFLPPSKNATGGWPPSWLHSMKRKWEKAVRENVEQLMIPPAARIGLSATLVFPVKARRDPQNYSHHLWHWVPDGLVKAGVIPDDHDGLIGFGRNLGIRMAIDDRVAPKEKRQRTHIALTMRVK